MALSRGEIQLLTIYHLHLNCEICEHSFNVDFKSQTELFYAA